MHEKMQESLQTVDPNPNEKDEHLNQDPLSLNQKLKRGVYLVLGFIFLGFGLIGLVFPVLPTTPFILLASICFMRSSSRFYLWIRYHPRFKSSFEKKGLTKQGKIVILAWAWIILILGAIFTPIL